MESILLPQITTPIKSVADKVTIIPVSSISLLVIFGNVIDITTNEKVMALHSLLKQKKLPWIKELTPAYASLGISYNLHFIKNNLNITGLVFDWVKNELENYLNEAIILTENEAAIIEIPVCFDGAMTNDLSIMSKTLDLSIHKIIDIFLNKTYHVFMLGFLPGFSYMGEVSSEIAIPRKKTPTPTKAGAVGIAGSQTGIYPLDSLGGWHIVGYTPLNMFNTQKSLPNFLQAGNKIRFTQITEEEYITMKNNTSN